LPALKAETEIKLIGSTVLYPIGIEDPECPPIGLRKSNGAHKFLPPKRISENTNEVDAKKESGR
jgi:hypothetical protein